MIFTSTFMSSAIVFILIVSINQKLGRNFDSQLIYSNAKLKVAENWVVTENWWVYPIW